MRHKNLLFLLFVNFNIFVINCSDNEEVLVTVDNGVLRGEKRGNYYAFEGIQYAEPPLGDLRFTSPRSYETQWTGIKNVTKIRPPCLQWDYFGDENQLIGDEDCLYLNVYSTNLDSKEKLPVIFHIHGGGYTFGSGDYYGHEVLMQQPIVYVNFNYRLGIFGFLSTGDDAMPGNFGLKDQVEALKWVKRNIVKFNGDPEKITITGFSAGGASVHLFYLSPLTKGIFNNGIAHSGSALHPWAMPEGVTEKTKLVATNLGCWSNDSMMVLKCLRSKSVAKLMKQFQILYSIPGVVPLGAVVEQKTKRNPQPFLTDEPINLLQNGNFYKVPIIFSLVKDEGLFPAALFHRNPSVLLQHIRKNWDTIMPKFMWYKKTVGEKEVAKNLQEIRQQFNLDLLPNSMKDFEKFRDIISDHWFVNAMKHAVDVHRKHSTVYYYHTDYKARYGFGELLSNQTEKNLGVAHGDDVFLFYSSPIRHGYDFTEGEKEMARKFTDIYHQYSMNR